MTRENKTGHFGPSTEAPPATPAPAKVKEPKAKKTPATKVTEPAADPYKDLAEAVIATGLATLEFTSPSSSNVQGAKFNPDTGVLTVMFRSGIYTYGNDPAKPGHVVTMDMWQHFRTFESKGIWVNSYLVGSDRSKPLYKGIRLGA